MFGNEEKIHNCLVMYAGQQYDDTKQDYYLSVLTGEKYPMTSLRYKALANKFNFSGLVNSDKMVEMYNISAFADEEQLRKIEYNNSSISDSYVEPNRGKVEYIEWAKKLFNKIELSVLELRICGYSLNQISQLLKLKLHKVKDIVYRIIIPKLKKACI